MSNLVKKDFRMPPEMATAVASSAAEMGISQSEFIRRVIDRLVAEELDATDTRDPAPDTDS